VTVTTRQRKEPALSVTPLASRWSSRAARSFCTVAALLNPCFRKISVALALGAKAITQCYDNHAEIDTLLDEVEQQIFAIINQSIAPHKTAKNGRKFDSISASSVPTKHPTQLERVTHRSAVCRSYLVQAQFAKTCGI
jgi:uncharacterized protein (UPF0210 family)